MPGKLTQKTLKIELEITVDMDELGDEHLASSQAGSLVHLQHLQQALRADDTALLELMLALTLGKMHEYIDYLTTQDDLGSLQRLVEKLEPEDRKFFQKYRCDFFDLTRPLRRACLSARLDHSQVSEQVNSSEQEPGWQPVWNDLAPKSELGRQLEKMSVSFAPSRPIHHSEKSHHIIARHLTRQKDGVHLEGRCTCDEVLEGVGADEDQAIDALWDLFSDHYKKFQAQESQNIK